MRQAMKQAGKPQAGKPQARKAGAARGAMSLEMVLMTPIFVLFLMLLAGAGRIVDAQSQVDGAARDAVRAASIARNAGDAQTLAARAATDSLGGNTWCQGGPQASVDTSDFRAGGTVTVTVTCQANLGDLAFIRLPATKSLLGKATAPIDFYTYRGGAGG